MKNKLFSRRVVLLLLLPLLFMTSLTFAQAPDAAAPAMADDLRASGKIYVVVAVVVVIIGGLLLYLISLDRKVRRLEQEIKN